MNKMILNPLVIAIGLASALTTTSSRAGVASYDWNGVFRFLDTTGNAIENSSISTKGANRFDTPISGTMAFDTTTGLGNATITPFDWGSNDAGLPLEVTEFSLEAIGDGMGGPGSLIVGNMLFNWNGSNGIPVSIVLDAKGFFVGDLDGSGGLGATPASDGTYVGEFVSGTVAGPAGFPGYLGLGPVPIATTAWNTTANCTTGVDCTGKRISGIYPLVYDTATNSADYIANTGGSIGGSPMLDGPFTTFNTGANFNFDFTDMTLTATDVNASINIDCNLEYAFLGASFGSPCMQLPEVPVPAAVWLFGSGMLGLIGVARRKKSKE